MFGIDVQALLQQALQNPVFSGVAGGTLMTGAIGFAVYQLRAIPGHIIALIETQFTVTLTVHNDASTFRYLDRWLSQHPSAKKTRRLTVQTWWRRGLDNEEHALTPGEGRHFIRQGKTWFMVRRVSSSQQGQTGNSAPNGANGQRQEQLVFTAFGRSQKPFRDLLAEASGIAEDSDAVPIHMGGIGEIGRRAKRPLSTIYLAEKLKADLVSDLETFLGRREFYAKRGVPWRRGYMLSGPPGTGKSSLIFALAGHFNKPLYIVNPATIANDSALHYALNSANGFVVLEDIDSVEVLKARPNLDIVRKQAEERAQSGAGRLSSGTECSPAPPTATQYASGRAEAPSQAKPGEGLTLSGFLNAIDGVGAHEGRVLFLTSNTPEALDAALMRPGRVDRRLFIGLATLPEALAMFSTFFPEGDAEAFAAMIAPQLPMACAELQDMLLAMDDGATDPVGDMLEDIEARMRGAA
jgi:mitochondrial chaperone BCS1